MIVLRLTPSQKIFFQMAPGGRCSSFFPLSFVSTKYQEIISGTIVEEEKKATVSINYQTNQPEWNCAPVLQVQQAKGAKVRSFVLFFVCLFVCSLVLLVCVLWFVLSRRKPILLSIPGSHPDSFPNTDPFGFASAQYFLPMTHMLGIAIASVFVGTHSDKFGRRPIFLI